MAEKAIQAAVDTGNPVSIHRTTLGYIYGQWIVHTIRSEISNKKLNRFAPSYDVLIDNIKVHYSLACVLEGHQPRHMIIIVRVFWKIINQHLEKTFSLSPLWDCFHQ